MSIVDSACCLRGFVKLVCLMCAVLSIRKYYCMHRANIYLLPVHFKHSCMSHRFVLIPSLKRFFWRCLFGKNKKSKHKKDQTTIILSFSLSCSLLHFDLNTFPFLLRLFLACQGIISLTKSGALWRIGSCFFVCRLVFLTFSLATSESHFKLGCC